MRVELSQELVIGGYPTSEDARQKMRDKDARQRCATDEITPNE
jgi:hypothetical protein